MSLYALLRNKPIDGLSMEEVNQAVKGNLCRCTGYRPILEAFYSFSCCGGVTGQGCPCKDGESKKLVTFDDMTPYDPTSEIIFPPKLLVYSADPLESQKFVGSRVTLYAPASMDDLKMYTQMEKTFKIVSSGMISRLIADMNPNNLRQTWVSIHRIPQLNEVNVQSDTVKIGSALSIAQLGSALTEHLDYAEPIMELFKKYSSEQVKSVASWAGAVASASATSDVCAITYAINVKLNILNLEKYDTRCITMDGLYDGHKTLLTPQDVILSVEFPKYLKNTKIYTYKQGERRGGDSTVVNMAAKIEIENGKIESSRIVLGLDRKHILAKSFSEAINKRKVDELVPLFDELILSLDEDMAQNRTANSFDFRRALSRAAVFDMFNKLSGSSSYRALEVTPDKFESSQVFKTIGANQSSADDCGRPLAHQYAGRHATGEAKYINDLKFDGMLHLAPVLSTEACAEIVAVDASAALKLHGVVDYIDVKDIPKGGTNRPGLSEKIMFDDTAIFAEGKVESIGQIIGAIIADDVLTARRAAKHVKVEYKKLPPIITIQEAISAKSYHVDPQIFGGKSEEEISAILTKCEHVVEGEFYMGGQEHIYLETQGTVVIPGEENE